MSPLHPLVQTLLMALLEGPMAALALRALAHIQDAEEGDGDRRVKRFDVFPEESSQRRGFRQLGLANEAILELLEGELALTTRLLQVAGKVKVDRIEVLPPPNRGTVEGPVDVLLSPERRAGIEKFVKAWNAAVVATRHALETGSAG